MSEHMHSKKGDRRSSKTNSLSTSKQLSVNNISTAHPCFEEYVNIPKPFYIQESFLNLWPHRRKYELSFIFQVGNAEVWDSKSSTVCKNQAKQTRKLPGRLHFRGLPPSQTTASSQLHIMTGWHGCSNLKAAPRNVPFVFLKTPWFIFPIWTDIGS